MKSPSDEICALVGQLQALGRRLLQDSISPEEYRLAVSCAFLQMRVFRDLALSQYSERLRGSAGLRLAARSRTLRAIEARTGQRLSEAAEGLSAAVRKGRGLLAPRAGKPGDPGAPGRERGQRGYVTLAEPGAPALVCADPEAVGRAAAELGEQLSLLRRDEEAIRADRERFAALLAGPEPRPGGARAAEPRTGDPRRGDPESGAVPRPDAPRKPAARTAECPAARGEEGEESEEDASPPAGAVEDGDGTPSDP